MIMEEQKEGHKLEQKEPECLEQEWKDGPADIVFYGGKIYTIDDKNPKVQALAVKGERIIGVGDFDDMKPRIKYPKTQLIDLKGKTLLPGFVSAHEHATFVAAARFLYKNISAYGNNKEERDKDAVLKIIKDEIAQTDPDEEPQPWCIFFGWDIELIPELPTLSAKVLDDEFSKKIPLLVVAQSGHAAWINNKAFEVCNITSPEQCPPGGTYVTDENGKLTGLLLEEPAIKSVLKHALTAWIGFEAIKAIPDQWKDYSSRGFTTVTELAYDPVLPVDLLLSAIAAFDHCPVRLGLYVSTSSKAKPQIFKSSKIWVAGAKIWVDGSPHCGTAAVKDPYLKTEMTKKLAFPPPPPPPPKPDPPNCGFLNWSNEDLYKLIKQHHDEGKQVSLHTNGDRAIDQALKIFKELQLKPEDDRRHRLEHVGVITEDQFKLCKELGILPSLFVYQLYFYGEVFEKFTLGEERTNRWCPMSTAVEYIGAEKISIHEDHPTFPGPPFPFANIKTAVTRTQRKKPNKVYGKEYCITIEQAIKALTIGPAYQLFKENEIGSLEVGKFADLLILSADPFTMDPLKLDTDIEVVETYTGGRCNHIKKMFKK